MYCIGYSFRDTHVNDIFKKHMEKGNTLIAISPSVVTDYHVNLMKETLSEKEIESMKKSSSQMIKKTDPEGLDNRDIYLIQKGLDDKSINEIILTIQNIISK